MKNEIIIFENQNIKLEVNLEGETVWLNRAQISELFERDIKTIGKHINNALKEELSDIAAVAKFATTASDGKTYNVEYYNLDVIISVGYRVKSQNGIIFRKWANNILKEYLLKGYALNQRRLEYLEKTVKLIDIATRADERLDGDDAKEVLKVIKEYSKALNILDDYDHKTLSKIKGKKSNKKINYDECKNIVNLLRFKEESDLFALERENGLNSIIENIYQTYDGQALYTSVQEKLLTLFICL